MNKKTGMATLRAAVVLSVLVFGSSAVAEGTKEEIKDTAKTAGHAVASTARKVGHGIKHVAKKTGHAIHHGARSVKNGVKRAVKGDSTAQPNP